MDNPERAHPPQDAPPEDEPLCADRVARRRASYEDILYERREGIAKITINRPEVRNAFRPQTLAELRDAFGRARDDLEVGDDHLHRRRRRRRSARAATSGFAATTATSATTRSPQQGVGRLDVGDLHVQIRRLPKPVVAMVAGYAVGGGHILHLVCDLTIAADNARFGQTGPRVGSFDGGFGAGLLARNVGVKRAKEIWFLCRLYDAERGARDGARQRGRPARRARARDGRLVPRDVEPLAARAAAAEGELQRRRGRARRAAAALPRRDAALLHDRGGPGGPQRLRRGPPPRLLEVPASGPELRSASCRASG